MTQDFLVFLVWMLLSAHVERFSVSLSVTFTTGAVGQYFPLQVLDYVVSRHDEFYAVFMCEIDKSS